MLRWADGFDWMDCGTNGSPYLKYPGSFETFTQVGAIAGRFGQGALDLENSAFGEMNFTRTFSGNNKWYAGFAFQPRRGLETAYNTLFFRFEHISAGGTVIAVRYNPSAQLEVLKGGSGTNGSPGTLVAIITALTLVLNTWVYLELVVEQAGANSVLQVWANDVQILDLGPSGADGTVDLTGLGQIDRATFRWQSLGKGYAIDDYYVCDDQGTFNNARLGPVQIVSTVMNADVFVTLTRNSGSSDASCINELLWPPGVHPLGSPDGDNTYLTGLNTFDLWTCSPFACTAKILALALNADFKALTSDTLAYLFKTGSVTTTVGSKSPSASGAYEVLQVIQEDSIVNPGSVWVDGEINSNLWGLSPSDGHISQFVLEKILTLRNVPYTCGTSPTTGNSYAF